MTATFDALRLDSSSHRSPDVVASRLPAIRPLALVFWLALLAVGSPTLAGCSDEDGAASGNPTAQKDGENPGFEVVGGLGDAADTTVAAGDGASEDTAVDAAIEEGAFGWPCLSNEECDSSFCIPTTKGDICTVGCIDNCPDGFKCGGVVQNNDVVYICIDGYAQLCDPCSGNVECNSAGEIDNVCVSYGNDDPLVKTSSSAHHTRTFPPPRIDAIAPA